MDLLHWVYMINHEALKDKIVLLRLDLDVPIKDGQIENDYRLAAAIPTLKLCLEAAKKTLVIGHLGRPEVGDRTLTLKPVAERAGSLLQQSFLMIDSLEGIGEWQKSDSRLGMLENLRFYPGELELNEDFAKEVANGFDIYIYEAFASYNQAASLNLIPKFLPTFAGLQFDAEIENLEKIRRNPERPAIVMLSGAKDDKAKFVPKFETIFDQILIGGRLASLWKTQEGSRAVTATLTPDGLDISDQSITAFLDAIQAAKTVVLNGPLGKFEDGVHAKATREVLTAIKTSPVFSLLGGGDTLSAITSLGFQYTDFDFVSTGGGAMLEYLATGTHPLLEIISANR